MQTRLDDPRIFNPPGFSENELPPRAPSLDEEAAPAPPEPIPGEKPAREGGRDSLFVFAGLAGLSLLLLALLGGAAYYLSLYPSGLQESCVVDASVHCVSWRLSPAGKLELKLANGHADTLFLDGVACSGDPSFDGRNASLERLGVAVKSGDAAEISVACTGPGGAASAGLAGEAFDGRLFVKYHLAGEPAGSRGVLGSLKTRRA
ncbi:MAG: hypothetical protein QXH27_04755 [Candidatus Micrarchaeia archaeon]